MARYADIDMLRFLAANLRGMNGGALDHDGNTAMAVLRTRQGKDTEDMCEYLHQVCNYDDFRYSPSVDEFFDALSDAEGSRVQRHGSTS
jgi:hypothetical protein